VGPPVVRQVLAAALNAGLRRELRRLKAAVEIAQPA
jgi:hypothetical protein